MKKLRIHKNFLLVLLTDAILLAAALYFSFLVRFDFDIPAPFMTLYFQLLLPIIITKVICFYFFDLYRGMWRYTSIADLLNIIKASALSALLIIAFIFLRFRFIGYPRSVFLIDLNLTILLVGAFRLGVRLYYEYVSYGNLNQSLYLSLKGIFKNKNILAKNLLIIGAGDGGEKIYREIRDNARLQYRVVGFLDDDTDKVGRKIHGIPVLGQVNELTLAVANTKAEEALIAIPSANSQQMRRIVELCKKSEIPFRTIPGYGELINGKVTINSIREVAYRDLLGRELVELEMERIGAYIENQNVMVTGAGGSIGSELCRQICRFRPAKIILVERAESPLYAIELDLKREFKNIVLVPVLADIQDKRQIEKAFKTNVPQIVFHAAAYKHVPMLELQPWKAIDNNVIGTKNLVEIAATNKVQRFVFVSTDKAVRPTNVMGASKRVAEMMIQNQNACGPLNTKFMIVRFETWSAVWVVLCHCLETKFSREDRLRLLIPKSPVIS